MRSLSVITARAYCAYCSSLNSTVRRCGLNKVGVDNMFVDGLFIRTCLRWQNIGVDDWQVCHADRCWCRCAAAAAAATAVWCGLITISKFRWNHRLQNCAHIKHIQVELFHRKAMFVDDDDGRKWNIHCTLTLRHDHQGTCIFSTTTTTSSVTIATYKHAATCAAIKVRSTSATMSKQQATKLPKLPVALTVLLQRCCYCGPGLIL